MKINAEKLQRALYKRALGYTVTEENEEFTLVDGALVLTKRKVSTKEVPPELKAIEMLSQGVKDDYSEMSEGELEQEKLRLLRMLKELDGNEKQGKEGKRIETKCN